MVRLEKALDESLSRLQDRYRLLADDKSGGDGYDDDDLDSIASSSVMMMNSATNIGSRRFFGMGSSSREAERLKHKVMSLERENFGLKQQVAELQRLLRNGITSSQERPLEVFTSTGGSFQLRETDVWNLSRTTSSNR